MKAKPIERQPWHYDVLKGRPEWSTQLARIRIIQREHERLVEKRSRAIEVNG